MAPGGKSWFGTRNCNTNRGRLKYILRLYSRHREVEVYPETLFPSRVDMKCVGNDYEYANPWVKEIVSMTVECKNLFFSSNFV